MKKFLILIVGIILVVGFGYFGWTWNKKITNNSQNTTDGQNEGRSFQVSGVLMRNNPGLKQNVWYILRDVPGSSAENFTLNFTSSSECFVGNKSTNCLNLDFPNGTRARVRGEKSESSIVVTELVSENSADLIVVDNISSGDKVKSPLSLAGKARGTWYFEASFPVRIIGKDGAAVTTTYATAQSEWMTSDFVPFLSNIYFNVSTDTPADLVLAADNPSGLPQNDREIRIPIILVSGKATRSIDLYYYDSGADTDVNGVVMCSAAGHKSVKREIEDSPNIIFDTVKLLVEGKLTAAEKSGGLSTEFPLAGLKLSSLTIEKGVASLTFLDPNNKTSGGSCRVSILRSQIEKTVRQFPGIKEVKIMPEDIFQP